MEPRYLNLHRQGGLEPRAQEAMDRLECCELCPRRCRVNRLRGETGVCQTGRLSQAASFNPHFGEEAPLVGDKGSGTIFFAGCNLNCVFCQNYEISHTVDDSPEMAPNQLAWIMLRLQEEGCCNINFVTPSHVVPQILEALPLAVDQGLSIPLVFNSSGYDLVETLRLLDGVVDIYMPDVKFANPDSGKRYCRASDYPEIARQAVREMRRQTGDLLLDENGLAWRGLLVRHLVMPEGLEETKEWMLFLAKEISPETYVNIMGQYRPCGEADGYPEICRRLTPAEYQAALDIAREAGLTRLDDRCERQAFRLLQNLFREKS